MEKKESKFNLILMMIFLIITLVIGVVGITYAYYKFQVEKINISSILIEATDLVLVYDETLENISGTAMTPGWNAVKTFSIRNDGGKPAHYSISWDNVTNGFTNKDFLSYTISSTAGNGCSKGNTTFPTGASEICRAIIGAGETQTYTLTMNYFDSPSMNLASDMEKSFAGSIKITGLSNDTGYTVAAATTNGTITGGTSMTNMITNSNFETDTTGWTLGTNTTRSAENENAKFGKYSIKNSFNERSNGVYSDTANLSLNASNKYYIGGYLYTNAQGDSNRMYNHVNFYYSNADHWQSNSDSNNKYQYTLKSWERKGDIYTTPNQNGIILKYAFSYNSGTDCGTEGYGDGAMALDLTALGLASKDLTWLDNHIPFFEGTGSVRYYDNVNAITVGEINTTSFIVTPATGKVYKYHVCDGNYRSAIFASNTLTVTGASSNVQCSIFYGDA